MGVSAKEPGSGAERTLISIRHRSHNADPNYRPTPARHGRPMNGRFILQAVIAHRRLNPAKLCGDFIDTTDLGIIHKQQLEKDIQVQCAAKALDQRDLTGMGCGLSVDRLLGQIRGKGAIDDTQGFTHDF